MSEKRSKWPMVIGGLLTLHVLASLFFVYLATSNPSFAVEEDYYQKALAFDETRAQDARNRALGWSIDCSMEAGEKLGQPATLTVRLLDRDGAPLDGAAMSVQAFPIARADQILGTALRGGANGTYLAALPIRRFGRWELRFDVQRDGQRFTHTTVIFLAGGRAR